MASPFQIGSTRPSARTPIIPQPIARLTALAILLTALIFAISTTVVIFSRNNDIEYSTTSPSPSSTTPAVAFIGNSIQYFNDCPRLVQSLYNIKNDYNDNANDTTNTGLQQDSCLRGGTSLVKILSDGNGMSEKFATPNALLPDGTYDVGAPTVQTLLSERDWDYVVMNDYTQSPARADTRATTVAVLQDVYSLFFDRDARDRRRPVVPIFLMTWAYRDHGVKNSTDLGTVDEFTAAVREGYRAYAAALDGAMGVSTSVTRIAPVGMAFYHVYNTNLTLWERLFYVDGLHPSPLGSYLEACVLYRTIFGAMPAKVGRREDVTALWARARRMMPPEEVQLDLPSVEDCGLLWDVAELVCQREGLALNGGGFGD